VALGLARNDPDLERAVAELSVHLGVDLTLPATPAKPTPARPIAGKPAPAKLTPVPAPKAAPPPPQPPKLDPVRQRALLTIAALERFLDAVHVVRTHQHA
jgi:hypothetical protein